MPRSPSLALQQLLCHRVAQVGVQVSTSSFWWSTSSCPTRRTMRSMRWRPSRAMGGSMAPGSDSFLLRRAAVRCLAGPHGLKRASLGAAGAHVNTLSGVRSLPSTSAKEAVGCSRDSPTGLSRVAREYPIRRWRQSPLYALEASQYGERERRGSRRRRSNALVNHPPLARIGEGRLVL